MIELCGNEISHVVHSSPSMRVSTRVGAGDACATVPTAAKVVSKENMLIVGAKLQKGMAQRAIRPHQKNGLTGVAVVPWAMELALCACRHVPRSP